MNSQLSLQQLENSDYAAAADELLQNVERLIAAGCFEPAHVALNRLLQPGAWQAGGHGRIAAELERLLPLVCYLVGKPSPKIRHIAAMSVPELAQWAEEQSRQILDMLEMPSRFQLKPAGEEWSEAYLQSLPDIADEDARRKAFNNFCVDAEFLLKSRLANGRWKLPAFIASFNKDNPDENLASRFFSFLFAPPKIAAVAQTVSTAAIIRAVSAYLERTSTPSGSEENFIFQAAVILSLYHANLDEAAVAAKELARSDRGLTLLAQSAVWPPVADLLKSGCCAAVVGVDAEAAMQYIQALQRRPLFRPSSPSAQTVPSVQAGHEPCSFEALKAALAATPLAGREVCELPILDTDECAYALKLDPKEMETLWQAARGLVDATQRWPVLAALWGGHRFASFQEHLLDEDLFSRFYYEDAPDTEDVSPRAILAAADSAQVEKFLQQQMQARVDDMPLDEYLDCELDSTRYFCNAAPSAEEIAQARLFDRPVTDIYQLDRWLLDWERAHGLSLDLDRVRQKWFEPDTAALLFLPTPYSWDTLAYLNFYGSAYHGVENYIALGRQWRQRYGAELVAHFGTMLQCYVSRPPASAEDAWQLAVEQDIFGPYTLVGPGFSLRHHALGLIDYDRWFLHERP